MRLALSLALLTLSVVVLLPGVWALPVGGGAPPLPADTLPEDLGSGAIPLGLDAPPPPPPENPTTPEKVALGRALFFDPRLSRDESVSCATCHRPEHGLASPDARAVGLDGRRGARNAPSLFNRAYGRSMFWDGRTSTLEEQALEPFDNAFELDLPVATALARLAGDAAMVARFAAAFPEDAESLTATNLARALAAFQRVLLNGDSPVDRFHAGEYGALSDAARQGLWIFESRGGCWRCHSGSNLSDEEFHNTGVAYLADEPDMGRFFATGRAEHESRFKTPSLRGVAETAPYMHDGRFATLREVVEFYDRGGNREAPGLAAELVPLELTEAQIGFLVAFLEALSPAGEDGDAAADRVGEP
ncbi:MAG: cytochrome-c peroxidase [Planctomycetota bacterium]